MSFDHLIRFVDDKGAVRYGNLDKVVAVKSIVGSKVQLLSGNFDDGFQRTDDEATVHQLLSPVPSTPILLCVGLNYKLHSKETDFPIPSQPVIFATPPDRLTGPLSDIPVHPVAQSELDYEGELTVLIGKEGKNIPESEALDYVLGYTVGNDVSARNLLPTSISGTQMGYAKSFDSFGPIGPTLVSTKVIPDPQKLRLKTRINGDLRQDASTSEMFWTVKQIIAHASQGRTLRKGTLIMTGTPNGVGWFSNGFVKHGDIMNVEIDRIGSIQNRLVFE